MPSTKKKVTNAYEGVGI